MNIYAEAGTKVVYTDTDSYASERERARNVGFVKGGQYTVKYTIVESFSTDVYFNELPGGWNSVMFEDCTG